LNREKARKPYLIYGAMYMTERIVAPYPVISTAKPEQKPGKAPKTGDIIIQEYNCRVCHTIQGSGGTVGPKLNAKNIGNRFHGDKEKLKLFLVSPPGVMPPFDGSPEDRESLATYLLQLQ
jgi:mono/diheme cytochrome c family protein